MEIIIGREEGARRLHCIADGREFNIGNAGCIPQSVSRKHCKIVVNNESITIENLQPQNITYVDGNQIFSKAITETSKVQLGAEKVSIPLQLVLKMACPPKEFSLIPLKSVWEEYEKRRLEIQVEAAKKANQQRIQGIISMMGMAFGLLPVPIFFRIACVVAALSLSIYFFVQGTRNSPVQLQLHDLDDEYRDKYKCPNPECGKPFGYISFYSIEYNKQCSACGCKYTH